MKIQLENQEDKEDMSKGKTNKVASNKKWIGIIIGVVLLLIAATAVVSVMVYRSTQKAADKVKKEAAADGAAYDYQKSGVLKLGTYKDVVVDLTASDDDLQYAIDEFCNKNGVKKDVILKKGDTINIDYTGSIDGKEFEGGSSEDEVLTLGDYEYLEEFEDGLIGKEVGTTVTVPVKFPEDYGDEELNGKQAQFKITINSVTAPFTDETVKTATKGKYKTTKEYEEKLKKDIIEENEEAKLDTAWEQIKEATELSTVPEAVQTLAEEDTMLMYEQFAELQGASVAELLEQFGMTEDDIPELATDLAKERMIAKTIASIEGITMDDTYYKQKLFDAVGDEEAGEMSLEELEKNYKETQSSRPKDDMLIQKVKEFISESVKVTGK